MEQKRPPSLYSQGQEIERAMYLIDNEPGQLEEHIVNEFQNLRENHSDLVNNAIFRIGALDMYIAEAARQVDEAKDRLAKLNKAKESYERYITACVRSVSFPLKGTHGEFSIKTKTGYVEFSVPTTSKSLSNVVPNELVDTIPQQFLEKVELFRIRKGEVNTFLKSDGATLPFATLVKEQSLCLKKLKPLLS